MKLGDVLKKERERKGISGEEIANHLRISVNVYWHIESGESELEKYAEMILNFANAVEQPVSNIFYPCGLPFQELEDYEIKTRP